VILFDDVARKLTDPQRFAASAERRLKAIAEILGLKKDGPDGRYALRGAIPYFVHDPKVLSYGNVEFSGIDVPAIGQGAGFYKHEEAHAVLMLSIGVPPALFNEGFACLASHPQSSDDHRCSLVGLRHGLIPPLAEIAWSAGFWKHYKAYRPFMYRWAGSFVAWAFDEYGREPFVAFTSRCGYDAAGKTVLAEFRRAYGISLSVAQRRWKAWLLSREGELAMNPRRRIGNISQAEWQRSRVQMVRAALAK
jgi:hypothetical protein